MKFTSVILPVVFGLKLVSAHTSVFAVFINDADQGLGNNPGGYIRSPPNNSPILDVTSSDMTCNVNGKNAAARTLTVKPGDKFTFEWHHNNRDPGDDIVDPSHKGPVMVYIAPTVAGTSGNGWVKIAEDGFDPSTGLFAVNKLINDKGKHSVTIPNVAAGDYLLRAEIIALHEANRKGGAQFYMECVQVTITQSGGITLPAGVSFPGAYTAEDPGVLFDLYSKPTTSYPIPGPPVFDFGSNGGTQTSSSNSSSVTTGSSSATTTSAGSQSTFATRVVRRRRRSALSQEINT